jgi:hypothetical protein
MDSSIKFCRIAEGAADIYPRHGPTMEWDTAAGHAVLIAAGGQVTTPDGEPFLYGKASEGFRNGWFVARGLEAGDGCSPAFRPRRSPGVNDPLLTNTHLTSPRRAAIRSSRA